MNTYTDKTTDTKSNAVANGIGAQQAVAHEETVHSEDNRPEATAQRKIQEAVNNSEQVKQLRTVQAMADDYIGKPDQQKKENKTGLPDSTMPKVESPAAFSLDAVELPLQQKAAPASIIQRMRFKRFDTLNFSFIRPYNEKENKLLKQELRLREFLVSMLPEKDSPYAGGMIGDIETEFKKTESAVLTEDKYEETRIKLSGLFYQLDNIASRIAAKKFPPNTQQLHFYIGIVNESLEEQLDTPENREVIQAAILSDLVNTKNVIQENLITPGHLDFAQTRMKLLLVNFKKILERVNGDWKSISKLLGLTGKLKFIHLTGSDFHNLGQSVCILESAGGQKAVYKPRSLSPDKTLEGGDDSIHKKLGLSTATFTERTDKKDLEAYGYMNFLQKGVQLTNEQAKNYYYEIGKMAVSTKLLGVTDLHNENILTGPGGRPIIIDAETSFLPNVMMSEAWSATGISDTLTSHMKLGKLTPNHFYTDEELLEWSKLNKTETPDSKFITEKRNASFRTGGVYRADFERGIKVVIDYVNQYKDQLKKYLLKKAASVTHVRIVPIDTLLIKNLLYGYIKLPTGERPAQLKKIATYLAEEFEKEGYEPLENAELTLIKGLAIDFNNTDLPIFYYEPSDNCIYFKDVPFAKYPVSLKDVISTNVERISKTTVKLVIDGFGFSD